MLCLVYCEIMRYEANLLLQIHDILSDTVVNCYLLLIQTIKELAFNRCYLLDRKNTEEL